MDATPAPTRDCAVDVMDVVIFDVYLVVISSRVFGQNINTKQIFFLISAVIVGDLQIIQMDVFSIEQ